MQRVSWVSGSMSDVAPMEARSDIRSDLRVLLSVNTLSGDRIASVAAPMLYFMVRLMPLSKSTMKKRLSFCSSVGFGLLLST